MTKDELTYYKDMRLEIKQLAEQIKTLELSLQAPGIRNMTGMPAHHSTDKDKLGDAIARLEELRGKYLDKCMTLENAIEILSPDERLVMRYRYIEGLKWDKVMNKIGYMSWATMHRVHKKALRKLKVDTL